MNIKNLYFSSSSYIVLIPIDRIETSTRLLINLFIFPRTSTFFLLSFKTKKFSS